MSASRLLSASPRRRMQAWRQAFPPPTACEVHCLWRWSDGRYLSVTCLSAGGLLGAMDEVYSKRCTRPQLVGDVKTYGYEYELTSSGLRLTSCHVLQTQAQLQTRALRPAPSLQGPFARLRTMGTWMRRSSPNMGTSVKDSRISSRSSSPPPGAPPCRRCGASGTAPVRCGIVCCRSWGPRARWSASLALSR